MILRLYRQRPRNVGNGVDPTCSPLGCAQQDCICNLNGRLGAMTVKVIYISTEHQLSVPCTWAEAPPGQFVPIIANIDLSTLDLTPPFSVDFPT